MKTVFQVQDDEFVPAESPQALVEYLWRTSMVPMPTQAAYRERAAYWVSVLRGVQIRTTDDESFVADMLEAGVYCIERVS